MSPIDIQLKGKKRSLKKVTEGSNLKQGLVPVAMHPSNSKVSKLNLMNTVVTCDEGTSPQTDKFVIKSIH